MQKKTIALIVTIIILAFVSGAQYGEVMTIREIVKIGLILMDKQKIDITLDEQMITNAFLQYKNNIGGCLFLENETLELK